MCSVPKLNTTHINREFTPYTYQRLCSVLGLNMTHVTRELTPYTQQRVCPAKEILLPRRPQK